MKWMVDVRIGVGIGVGGVGGLNKWMDASTMVICKTDENGSKLVKYSEGSSQ